MRLFAWQSASLHTSRMPFDSFKDCSADSFEEQKRQSAQLGTQAESMTSMSETAFMRMHS